MFKNVNQTVESLGGLWLGSYLAGLIEGTGRFKPDRLELLLAIGNLPLAQTLSRCFNGQLHHFKKKGYDEPILILFFTQESLGKIINQTNGYYVGDSKLEQIKRYQLDQRFGIYLKPSLKKVDWDSLWLAGFFDVSASVTITIDRMLCLQSDVSGFVPSARARISFFNRDKGLLEYIAMDCESKVLPWPDMVDGAGQSLRDHSGVHKLWIVYVNAKPPLNKLFRQFELFGPYGFRRIQLEKALQCFDFSQQEPLLTPAEYERIQTLILQLEAAAKPNSD